MNVNPRVKTARIYLVASPEFKEQCQQQAKQDNITVTKLIETAVQEYIAKN